MILTRLRTADAVVLGTLAAMVLALVGTAWSQEDLYGPQAPVDVAYVRAVNVLDEGGLAVRVADGELEVLGFAGATAYVAVAPGPVRLDLGGEETVIDVEIGDFVTVFATREGALTIEDTPLRDASRGMLALYNLTDHESLALVVVDGPIVVEGVGPGTQASVAIAEAEVALSVRGGGETIDLEVRHFERGVAHAVIVAAGADGLIVAYVASRLDD